MSLTFRERSNPCPGASHAPHALGPNATATEGCLPVCGVPREDSPAIIRSDLSCMP
jgi:hypothetical protein